MHRLYRATRFALALSLALAGGVVAGPNENATFELTSSATVGGIGPGGSVTLDVAGSGYVGIKQLDVFVTVSDPAAFELTQTTLTLDPAVFAPGVWFALGAQVVEGSPNQVRLGGAALGQSGAVDGDGGFSINLVTSASFTGDTEATVTVSRISIGPSSSLRDEFTSEQLGLGLTVNPPVTDPTLTASTPTDVSLDFSGEGTGNAADGSAGEVTLGVIFNDETAVGASGQAIAWTVSNSGAETIYILGTTVRAVAAGAEVTVTTTTTSGGGAVIVLDAEGGPLAGSTSAMVTAATSADNTEGVSLDLSADFTVTWDVPVPAELASFTSEITAGRDVQLQWVVASQTNNLGWEVYRSVDNRVFERVSSLIPGEGTSDQLREYAFLDEELPTASAVFYYLKQIDLNGTTTRSSVIEVALDPTAVRDQGLPQVSALNQNYPNPFNPETTIRFDLALESTVSLKVYDLTGQVVRTLVLEALPAGSYTEVWDGRNAAGVKVGSGVYFYELRAGSFTSMKKMTLLQ